jgi:hypothetical protein
VTLTLKRILGVFEALRQIPPLRLAADVLLPFGAVLGAAGHHDLQRLRFPVEAQLDERVVEVHADVAAYPLFSASRTCSRRPNNVLCPLSF